MTAATASLNANLDLIHVATVQTNREEGSTDTVVYAARPAVEPEDDASGAMSRAYRGGSKARAAHDGGCRVGPAGRERRPVAGEVRARWILVRKPSSCA